MESTPVVPWKEEMKKRVVVRPLCLYVLLHLHLQFVTAVCDHVTACGCVLPLL